MNILHVSFSDLNGGAARAAYRIHSCLVEQKKNQNIISQMRVVNKISNDFSVYGNKRIFKVMNILKINSLLNKLFLLNHKSKFKGVYSPCIFKTNFLKKINSHKKINEKFLVHLHWIGNLMSIEQIGMIKKPIVWTLHDQWPFCGAEHYTNSEFDTDMERYIKGYQSNNKPSDEKGFDINKLTWERKKKSWKRPMYIACPSQWMLDCARKSYLMKDYIMKVIPNPIDTVFWHPKDKYLSRKLINLPTDKMIIVFGAFGATNDPRKGSEILIQAIKILKEKFLIEKYSNIHLVVFGNSSKNKMIDCNFNIHYFGNINDDIKLRNLYSAADLVVVPSKKESFGQVASEAHACGTPVVSFRTSGLKDIIDHEVTGYLAEPFEPLSLAFSIKYLLEDRNRLLEMSYAARERSLKLWDQKVIADKYINLYEEALES